MKTVMYTIKDAAAVLGISRPGLDQKMARLGIKPSVIGSSRVRVIDGRQLRVLKATMKTRRGVR